MKIGRWVILMISVDSLINQIDDYGSSVGQNNDFRQDHKGRVQCVACRVGGGGGGYGGGREGQATTDRLDQGTGTVKRVRWDRMAKCNALQIFFLVIVHCLSWFCRAIGQCFCRIR